MTTALGLIDNDSNLKFGESVLVIGCGGVGLNLISAAHLRGAGIVVGFDAKQEKNELALGWVQTHSFFRERKLKVFSI